MLRVVATLCALASPHECREVQVTTSEQSGVSLQGCMAGGPALAEFMRDWPAYRLAKWKCEMGQRGEKV